VTSRGPVEGLSFGLGVALLLAAVGQVLLLATPDQPTWGLLFYAAAVVTLIGLTLKIRQPVAPRPFVARQLPRQAPVVGLWFTCLVLGLYAVRQVNRDLPVADRYLLDAAWLASILAYTVSVLRAARWHWPGFVALRDWSVTHRRELALIGFLLVAAFAVRAYDLTYHPYSFVNDEGEVGKEALAILNGTRSNFFEAGWSGQPVWSFVPTAISVAVLGHTAVAGRLVSVVEGTLAVFFVYMLARETFDRKTAFLAGAVLVGLAWHIHFSRLGVSNVIDSFFASGVLWLTYRALRRGHLIDYLVAGLAAGLTLYTYLGSRLVLAMAVGIMAYVLVRQRDYFRTHYRHLSVYAGALLVVAGPNLAYFAQHPNEFMGRLNSEGILQNGWLQRQSVTLGRTYFSLLLEQFSHSTLVFIAQNAPGSFFNSPRPYLTALAAIFFVFGLAVSMWRITQPRYLLVCGWFWSVVVFGSTLTLGPPSSQRLIMTAPVAALLVAIGLREVARLAAALRLLTPHMGWIAAVGLVGIISAQGIAFYFGAYRLGHYYEDPSNDFSYEVSTYMETLGPSYHVFLLGDPSVYSGFADFGYLAPDVQVTDFNTVTPATFAGLPRDKGAFFVAIPRRVDDLRLVQQWQPGGTWQEALRRFQAPQQDYFAYQVPPSVFVKP
jgi:4-amino-4-deoxy-L-arabinose transferase-like glycosyltransferase